MEPANSLAMTGVEAPEIKVCCAAAYQSDWATWLLGESFHPGGLALTEHVGHALGLTPNMRVLMLLPARGPAPFTLPRLSVLTWSE